MILWTRTTDPRSLDPTAAPSGSAPLRAPSAENAPTLMAVPPSADPNRLTHLLLCASGRSNHVPMAPYPNAKVQEPR